MLYSAQFDYDQTFTKEQYLKLLTLAFIQCDSFMFVVPDYDKKIYTEIGESHLGKDEFKMLKCRPDIFHLIVKLAPYFINKVVSRSYGGYNCITGIYIFKFNSFTKALLEEYNLLDLWANNLDQPEDLHFFTGERCWFNSMTHEKLFHIYTTDEKDIPILKNCGVKFYEEYKTEETEIPKSLMLTEFINQL